MEFESYVLVLLRRPVDAPSYPDEELERIQEQHLAHLLARHPAARAAANRARRRSRPVPFASPSRPATSGRPNRTARPAAFERNVSLLSPSGDTSVWMAAARRVTVGHGGSGCRSYVIVARV